VLAAQAASACHWSWTAVGNDQRPTEGDKDTGNMRKKRCEDWTCTVLEICLLITLLRSPITTTIMVAEG